MAQPLRLAAVVDMVPPHWSHCPRDLPAEHAAVVGGSEVLVSAALGWMDGWYSGLVLLGCGMVGGALTTGSTGSSMALRDSVL